MMNHIPQVCYNQEYPLVQPNQNHPNMYINQNIPQNLNQNISQPMQQNIPQNMNKNIYMNEDQNQTCTLLDQFKNEDQQLINTDKQNTMVLDYNNYLYPQNQMYNGYNNQQIYQQQQPSQNINYQDNYNNYVYQNQNQYVQQQYTNLPQQQIAQQNNYPIQQNYCNMNNQQQDINLNNNTYNNNQININNNQQVNQNFYTQQQNFQAKVENNTSSNEDDFNNNLHDQETHYPSPQMSPQHPVNDNQQINQNSNDSNSYSISNTSNQKDNIQIGISENPNNFEFLSPLDEQNQPTQNPSPLKLDDPNSKYFKQENIDSKDSNALQNTPLDQEKNNQNNQQIQAEEPYLQIKCEEKNSPLQNFVPKSSSNQDLKVIYQYFSNSQKIEYQDTTKTQLEVIQEIYFNSNCNFESTAEKKINLLSRKKNVQSKDTQRFRNMKKLIMNGILKYLVPEILKGSSCKIPSQLTQEIIRIADIIRETGKNQCQKNKKMDLFSQPHFNALFLNLNQSSCSQMNKNKLNVQLHKQLYEIDISVYEDINPDQIQYVNTLKNFMYLIAKHFLENNQTAEGANVIRTYKKIVLISLQKMISGQYINKFQSYKQVEQNQETCTNQDINNQKINNIPQNNNNNQKHQQPIQNQQQNSVEIQKNLQQNKQNQNYDNLISNQQQPALINNQNIQDSNQQQVQYNNDDEDNIQFQLIYN